MLLPFSKYGLQRFSGMGPFHCFPRVAVGFTSRSWTVGPVSLDMLGTTSLFVGPNLPMKEIRGHNEMKDLAVEEAGRLVRRG